MKEEFNETDGGGMDEVDFELQVKTANFIDLLQIILLFIRS